MKMKEAIAIKLKNEWNRAHEKRTKIDHEIARIAFDIRAQFPEGDGGRTEAIDWVRDDLGCQLLAARSAIADGEAWGCVRNLDHWIAIGGIRSARVIASLTPKHRMIVLSESIAVADKRKRPISATTVREIAWRHGFVERETSKVTAAKQAATLTAFVNRLYATVQGLPPMPAEVRAIVKPPVKRLAKAA